MFGFADTIFISSGVVNFMKSLELGRVEIFGAFEADLPQGEEYLSIGFSPTTEQLKKRWENNGLSADFIADYFRIFYVSKKSTPAGEESAEEEFLIENLREGVKYVANELLENAMKFQDKHTSFTAHIVFSLYHDQLIFMVSNGATYSQAEKYRAFVQKIVSVEDPGEMYFDALQNSANHENSGHSGLGLLSMISDYSASLGWRFEYPESAKPNVIITTQVRLLT